MISIKSISSKFKIFSQVIFGRIHIDQWLQQIESPIDINQGFQTTYISINDCVNMDQGIKVYIDLNQWFKLNEIDS